jgi:hypothetical protein
MADAKSSFVQRLEELGFRKVKGEDGNKNLAEIERMIGGVVGRLSRNERRKMRRELRVIMSNSASFIINRFDNDALTEATDETGQLWEARGAIDLTPFDFADNAEVLRELLRPKKNLLNS